MMSRAGTETPSPDASGGTPLSTSASLPDDAARAEDGPRRGRHRLWWVLAWLARMGGGRSVEFGRTNAVQLGVIVLLVGTLVGGAWAATLALGLGVWWSAAAAVALVPATLVVAAARYLVCKVVEPRHTRDNVVAALAGTALALPVGGLLAVAFCLGTLHASIDAARTDAIERQFDDEVAPLRPQERSLREQLTDAATPHPEADAQLTDLQAKLAAAGHDLDDAEAKRRAERAGQNGTGVGPGGLWAEDQARVDRLTRQRDDLSDQVEAERPKAQQRAEAAAAARAVPVQKQLDGVVAQIDELDAHRITQLQAVNPGDFSAAAQRARAGALFSQLGSAPVAPAFWTTLVFSLVLQTAPVLLALMGGASEADDVAAARARYIRRHHHTVRSSADGGTAPLPRIPAEGS